MRATLKNLKRQWPKIFMALLWFTLVHGKGNLTSILKSSLKASENAGKASKNNKKANENNGLIEIAAKIEKIEKAIGKSNF